jgi:hypothetical protein
VEAGLYEDLLAELGQELTRAGVAARPIVGADAFAAHALHAIAERDGAEAIVVGAPHRAGAERVFGGDVAAATVHGAPVAVAVAPAGFAERKAVLSTVGVGYDGSAEARGSLRLGGLLARAAGATLRVVSVVSATVPEDAAASKGRGWHLRDRSRAAGRRAGPLQRRSGSSHRRLALLRASAQAAPGQHLCTPRARGELPRVHRAAPGRGGGRPRGSPPRRGGAVNSRLTRMLPPLTAAAIAIGGAAHLAARLASATRSGRRRSAWSSCRSPSRSRGR